MKRVIIYVRVSTDDQADRGYSLPSQLEACRRLAATMGYEVVLEVSEDYSGATPIAERPEGKKLAQAIKRRTADAVIIYNVDRLSRDIVDLLATVRTWLRAGIEIYSCDIGKIESEFDIVLVIKGWQGSDERKKIIERVSRGRFEKARSGKVVGSGRALYGYAYVKSEGENGSRSAYAICEAEAKIVRLIFNWYVLGDENGKRLSEFLIAKRLSEMGIPSPSASGGRKNPQGSKARGAHIWSISTIHNILGNEAYAGTWHFGKTIGNAGKTGVRPIAEQIPVKIPSIVERETWESVQTQRTKNKMYSPRNAHYFSYLLTGIFKCGCGASMYGYSKANAQGKRFAYYRCSQRTNRFSSVEQICTEHNVPAPRIEAFVWSYIKSSVSSSKRYEAALRKAAKSEVESFEPRREQLQVLEEQIADDDREFSNIAAELARGVTDKVREMLSARASSLEPLYNERTKARDELRRTLAKRIYTEERIQAALQFREDVQAGIENATEEDKRRWCQALNVQVTIKDRKARVKCLVPVKAGMIDFNIYSTARQQFVP